MKQIQLEAWHLVNLHTLRCLENGLSLPDYSNKTFFDHCCAGVSTTSHTHLIAQKNPDIWESIRIYQSQRERAGLSEVTHLTGYSELKHELREQMFVNAGVMIHEHFRTRLRLYVDITFGGLGSTLTKKQRKEKADLVKGIMHACYSVDETGVVEALQMRDALTPDGVGWSKQWIPWPSHIKENGMAFYVRLLWEFQDVIEKRMEAVPNEKGVRAFSLFPVSTKYSRAHITINGTTLAGFYSRIQKRVEGYRWDLPSICLTSKSFKANRWTVMRHAFDIARFETVAPESPLTKEEFSQLTVEHKYEHASHLFTNEVVTDGYSASVLLFRPKTEEQKAEEELEKDFDKESNETSVVPLGYVPSIMVGLDPGMRSICTAVREDFKPKDRREDRVLPPRNKRMKRQPRRRKRKRGSKTKRKKRDYPRWIKRPKAPLHRNERDIVSVTTREYRHMAGFNRVKS